MFLKNDFLPFILQIFFLFSSYNLVTCLNSFSISSSPISSRSSSYASFSSHPLSDHGTSTSATCQTWPYMDTNEGNEEGKNRKRCSPPQFQSIFSGQNLHPGSGLSLKCSAIGDPMPQIRWYLYSRALSDSYDESGRQSGQVWSESGFRTGDFLDSRGVIISHVNVSTVSIRNGGLYTCEAFSSLGTIRHSALIQVYGPPMIHAMSNLTMVTGDKWQLDCPVAGFPIHEIKWKKDGSDLPPSRRLKSWPNGTLSVVDAHLEDEGWYECQVRNEDSSPVRGSFFLDIVEKPVINPFIFGSDLREGMRTTVLCSILSGESPLTITWFKDNVSLPNVHPEAQIVSLGEFTSTVRISSVQRVHSGNYTCLASSPRTSSSFTAQMVVQASPKWILKPLQEYSVLKGKKLVIDCQAEGVPVPIHQWKRTTKSDLSSNSGLSPNNEFLGIVSGPHLHVLENGSLAIIDAEKSDEADYLCESSNGIGPVLSASTKVRVRSPPSFGRNFEVMKIAEGEKVTLTCDVYGDEPMKIVWSKEREVLNPSFMSSSSGTLTSARHLIQEVSGKDGVTKSARLTIDGVQVADSSNFFCSASNSFGSELKTWKLVVQGAPQVPASLTFANVTSRAVTLIWVPGHDGNSPIIAYTVQFIPLNGTWNLGHGSVTVTEKNQHLATISGLEPSSSYRFRISAENTFGRSRPTSEVVVKTDEEAPNQVPTNVRIETLSSRSIRVTWLMPTPPFRHYDGFHVGYKPITNEAIMRSQKSSFIFKTIDLGAVGRSNSGKNEFEAILNDLKRNTRYSIMIQAFNRKGSGPPSPEILAQTSEFDVPGSVEVKVTTLDHHSLSLVWESPSPDSESITGYVIKYKSGSSTSSTLTENDLWQEVKIVGKKNSFILENLKCGSQYQVTVAPFNKAGKADPSPVVTAATAGSLPSAPAFESLVSTNSTHAAISLSAWSDNGCPIMYFVVQYKERLTSEWIMLSNNIIPEQSMVYISDLFPSTWYDLAMTAHSEAGHREAQYLFSTLTPAGATISPLTTVSDASWNVSFYDSVLVAPLICTSFVLIVVFATIGYFMTMSSRPNERDQVGSEHYSTIGSRKLESLSMTSLGLKGNETGACSEHLNNGGECLCLVTPSIIWHVSLGSHEVSKNKIYDLVHREAGNGINTYYQSSFGTSDRIVGLISDGSDLDIGRRENLLSQQNVFLERHLHPTRNFSNGAIYEQGHGGHRNKDQAVCCEFNMNRDCQVMFAAQNRSKSFHEPNDV